MGAATTVTRRAHSHPRTTHSPKTMEEYARMFDRVLAAKYVQDLRTRLKQAQVGAQSQRSLPDLATAAAAMQSESALALRQRRIPDQKAQTFLMPRLDICECTSDEAGPSRVTATFELPGMNKADITLEVRSGWLIVEGMRQPPAQVRYRGVSVLTRNTEDAGFSAPSAQSESRSRSTPPKVAQSDDAPTFVPEQRSNGSLETARSGQDCRTGQPSQDIHMDCETNHTAHAHAIAEIRYGRFRRAVRLPLGTDASDIDANMADGMLVVSWPRSQQPPQQPKHIRVA